MNQTLLVSSAIFFKRSCSGKAIDGSVGGLPKTLSLKSALYPISEAFLVISTACEICWPSSEEYFIACLLQTSHVLKAKRRHKIRNLNSHTELLHKRRKLEMMEEI